MKIWHWVVLGGLGYLAWRTLSQPTAAQAAALRTSTGPALPTPQPAAGQSGLASQHYGIGNNFVNPNYK